MDAVVERFLNLANRDEVVEKVLEEWLLRELRDEIMSRLTWKRPNLARVAEGIRIRADRRRPLEVYFLSPVGIGGKFFYDHPVGETLYSAECEVLVEYEENSIKTRLAQHRLFWVGSADPRGYRISEGFDELFDTVVEKLAARSA